MEPIVEIVGAFLLCVMYVVYHIVNYVVGKESGELTTTSSVNTVSKSYQSKQTWESEQKII